MIKKNDLFEAEITAMTAEGSGICRADGMAVFVPGTAVGDRCVVRVVKVLKKYAFGRLEELLTPSPDRTTPDCPIAGPCGGSPWTAAFSVRAAAAFTATSRMKRS